MPKHVITVDIAKTMAKNLRRSMAEDGREMSHGRCLELVAVQLGYVDWNTAAAKLADAASAPDPVMVMPKGWSISGPEAQEYFIGTAADTGFATIQAIDPTPKSSGFATMMQSVQADGYRGKRVRLNAELQTVNALGAGTIWLRADDLSGRNVAFDNMENRSEGGVVVGTTEWCAREIVLEVPDEAVSLHYGFYLRGSGLCRARGFAFGVVGDEVPLSAGSGRFLEQPDNLDFAL